MNIRMKKNYCLIVLLFGYLFCNTLTLSAQQLPGFQTSPYYGEQVTTFKFKPDMRIHINAPSANQFDPNKPVGLALYALPNGNTIEQTVGKQMQSGDDWHFDIQHIGAQTRFLRNNIDSYNLVTVYLEATQKSWPAWKAKYPDYFDHVKTIVEHLKSYFKNYQPFVILTGHSGGGRFIFSFMDAFEEIPEYVDRICFLDSNYGYENSYGDQMIQWMNQYENRYISVLAYNDSVALYNGQPIVSPTGGTWYRSRMMQKYFANSYTFATEETEDFIRHQALDGRIKILLKKNPEKKILHTVQVERNGFIHTMLTGTELESDGYEYYGERTYSELIQENQLVEPNFQIPLRSPEAMDGSTFMDHIKSMSFANREEAILQELNTGNIPYFLRELTQFESNFQDAQGIDHNIKYRVMPNYLSIGSDTNYCRVPMGPITAQKSADFFGACMPTRKLVDDIYSNAQIKLAPVTYAPVGNQNETVQKFIEHNEAINMQFADAGGTAGQLTGGTKKDVVLSNKIVDPSRPNHVVIYGWHKLDGNPIQPLTNIHIDTYVDYSHGIRLLDSQIFIDDQSYQMPAVLSDANLYKTLSDESGPMAQPTYIADGSLPEKPKSFGLKCDQDGQLSLVVHADSNVDSYYLYQSDDGLNFGDPLLVSSNPFILAELPVDSIVFIKIKAENNAGSSLHSEVLAALPKTADQNRVLVVNGFDRPSTGNTFDFIRQHATSIVANQISFESATNDAVEDGLFSLSEYKIVDYILGDESTADESFSATEQILVSSFLKDGGRLFVSGAEVAWDLDYKGSTSDKNFMHNYLKSKYSADAPGGISGTYYSAEGLPAGILSDINPITFDNGSHGTINVKYADALIPLDRAKQIINYKNVNSHNVGGISFEGTFKDGSKPGKLVYLGFPFETIYPDSTRRIIMNRILEFLSSDPTNISSLQTEVPNRFFLAQNYPNPFNPGTIIQYQIPEPADVTLEIFNNLGVKIREWNHNNLGAGIYSVTWDGKNKHGLTVSSGTYYYRLRTAKYMDTKKLTFLH